MIDERNYYSESQTTKPAQLNCSFCRAVDTYELKWIVRRKKSQIPNGAGADDRARFAKAESYMVLLDDKMDCKKCRRRFDISGIRTTSLITA